MDYPIFTIETDEYLQLENNITATTIAILAKVVEFCSFNITPYSSCVKDCYRYFNDKLVEYEYDEDMELLDINDTLLSFAISSIESKSLYSFQRGHLHTPLTKKTLRQFCPKSSKPLRTSNILNQSIRSTESPLLQWDKLMNATKIVKSKSKKKIKVLDYENKPQQYLIDKSLCLLVNFYVFPCYCPAIAERDIGVKFDDPSYDCLGSLDQQTDYSIVSSSSLKDMHYYFNYKHQPPPYHSSETMQVADEDFILSANHMEGCSNLTHLFDLFELFYSFIAFYKQYLRERKYKLGVMMSFLQSLRCLSLLEVASDEVSSQNYQLLKQTTPIYDFFVLVMTSVMQICEQYSITIYIPCDDDHNYSLYLKNIFYDVSTKALIGRLEDRGLLKFFLQTRIVFPMVLYPLMTNVLTFAGQRLMQSSLLELCKGSVISSNVCYDSTCSDMKKIVIATRLHNRRIIDIEGLKHNVELVFSNSSLNYDVQLIQFSRLSSCEQINIMQDTDIFIYNHGAEGRMLSFMRSNTSYAIEILPSCGMKGYDGDKIFPILAYINDVKLFHFQDTLQSMSKCKQWKFHMTTAPCCGTIVSIDTFKDLLIHVRSIIEGNMF